MISSVNTVNLCESTIRCQIVRVSWKLLRSCHCFMKVSGSSFACVPSSCLRFSFLLLVNPSLETPFHRSNSSLSSSVIFVVSRPRLPHRRLFHFSAVLTIFPARPATPRLSCVPLPIESMPANPTCFFSPCALFACAHAWYAWLFGSFSPSRASMFPGIFCLSGGLYVPASTCACGVSERLR